MPAVIRSLLLSGEALNGENNARKSAAAIMEIQMVTIGRSSLCLNMAGDSNIQAKSHILNRISHQNLESSNSKS